MDLELVTAPVTDFDVTLENPAFIKPAESCPNTSPLYLSNIDQALAFTVETIYFYGANLEKPNDTVADTMREALSKILVHYDFLAGRARFNEQLMRMEIDRNYAGAQFASASCEHTIAELGDVSAPNPLFRKFVPQAHNAMTIGDIPLLMIQVTTFKCGGFAIGFGISHLVWDGHGMVEFLMNLVSFAQGGPLVFHPQPEREMFKPQNMPNPRFDHPEFLKLDELPTTMHAVGHFTTADAPKAEFERISAPTQHVIKIISFTQDDLKTLKSRAMEGGTLTKVSTFDALSGHFWQARTRAIESEPAQLAQLLYAVDIRGRIDPPLPKQFCGNGIYSACARATCGEIRNGSLSFCVDQIQKANERITNEYIRSGIDWLEVYHGIPAISSGIFISSWQKMPFYAIDFGWGRPLFAGPVVSPMVEFVVILPNGKHDGGLNIILALYPKEMAKFEEFIKVSP